MVKILVFGDSITWGAFDIEKGGWAERLKQEHLQKTMKTISPDDYYVYNLGIESASSKTLLQRFESQVDVLNNVDPGIIDTIIFAIGINDASIYDNNSFVPLKNFKENIKKLYDLAQNVAPNIVFVGITKVDESRTNPLFFNEKLFYNNENLKIYDNEIENFCNINDVHFIPVWDLLYAQDLKDGLHPNSQGHEKIYKVVKKYLDEKILK